MTKIKTRDCGIPDLKLLRARVKVDGKCVDPIRHEVSDLKMKKLRKEIFSKIPVSGNLIVFKVLKEKENSALALNGVNKKVSKQKIEVFRIVRASWGLSAKVKNAEVAGLNMLDDMITKLIDGTVEKFFFRMGSVDTTVANQIEEKEVSDTVFV